MTSKRLRHLGAALVGAAFLTASAGLVASSGQEPGAARQPAGKADDGQPSPDDQVEALVREYEDGEGGPPAPVPGSHEGSREKPGRAQGAPEACMRTSPGDSWRWPRRYPRTNAAEQALTWLVCNDRSFDRSPEAERAREILARDHVRSDRIKAVLAETSSVVSWALPDDRGPAPPRAGAQPVLSRSAASPATGWRSSSSSGRIGCGSGNCWGARPGATTVDLRAARSRSP